MIPIEEKLANETRKTDIIAVVRSVKWKLPFANSVIATNSFVTSLVAMILPASTASFHGIPLMKARGAKM